MTPSIVAFRETDRVVVCVSGELDLASHELLTSRCAEIVPAPVELDLDLRRLTFVDCGSLRVLARLARDFAELGGRPRVVAPAGPVGRIIAAAGFFDDYAVVSTPSTVGGLRA